METHPGETLQCCEDHTTFHHAHCELSVPLRITRKHIVPPVLVVRVEVGGIEGFGQFTCVEGNEEGIDNSQNSERNHDSFDRLEFVSPLIVGMANRTHDKF